MRFVHDLYSATMAARGRTIEMFKAKQVADGVAPMEGATGAPCEFHGIKALGDKRFTAKWKPGHGVQLDTCALTYYAACKALMYLGTNVAIVACYTELEGVLVHVFNRQHTGECLT